MKRSLVILVAILMALLMFVASCDNNKFALLMKNDKTTNDNVNHDDDGLCAPADPRLTIPAATKNNLNPSGSFAIKKGTRRCVEINLPGLVDPVTGNPIELERYKNIWIEEDGKPKGFVLTKVDVGNILKADVVFTVDNSGSMGGEANGVAQGIVALSQALETSGLDVRFASVGQSYGVNGALNFSTAQRLEQYLNFRNGNPVSGTSRTRGYEGDDAGALQTAAGNFHSPVGGENGVVAVLYAEATFAWRPGASHQFINFTDEPTQPDGETDFSTQTMCDSVAGKATVHTVWSGSSDTTGFYRDPLEDEAPWDMSACTGGMLTIIKSDASDLDLSNLPIVGQLSNSYLITFQTSDPNKKHTLRIVIVTQNADGVAVFTNITYGP